MLVVVTLVALLVQIYSISYMHDDENMHKFFAYLNLFVPAIKRPRASTIMRSA